MFLAVSLQKLAYSPNFKMEPPVTMAKPTRSSTVDFLPKVDILTYCFISSASVRDRQTSFAKVIDTVTQQYLPTKPQHTKLLQRRNPA